jgi:hypothetical protein
MPWASMSTLLVFQLLMKRGGGGRDPQVTYGIHKGYFCEEAGARRRDRGGGSDASTCFLVVYIRFRTFVFMCSLLCPFKACNAPTNVHITSTQTELRFDSVRHFTRSLLGAPLRHRRPLRVESAMQYLRIYVQYVLTFHIVI